MNLTAFRYLSTDDASLSRVAVDGEMECYGLEDQYQEKKVANETRIPSGTYAIKLRTEGGMNARYAQAAWCKQWHIGMLWLQDVPNFEWIYIHPGNTDDHTSGCLLVGDTKDEDRMTIGRSRIAYERLYKKIIAELAKGEPVTIEFVDGDRDEFNA